MSKALNVLDARADTHIQAVSPVYRTPPWGKTDQPWFHNACAEVETTLAPLQLIAACLDIEQSLKRVRQERWGPRIIDIDILAMDQVDGKAVVLSTPQLEIPHPRMHERAFVLLPLSDIAPDLRISGHSVTDWLKAISTDKIEKARTDAGWWQK
ncbi:2-amino-4-hydroxy-6-hydroxymethyldihydropteridine diphosphokinase [Brucella sp. BE17]|uniref:2-amino-4-hydroxy-6- hydroxymethyldihydropteridine diphosphokinase n=1 Tax=Brucella sp. BE17 TaxID=3142977 RepID=UPI0031BB397C